MRLTTRGWAVLWVAVLAAVGGLLVLVDAYVLDLTPTEAEMESLR